MKNVIILLITIVLCIGLLATGCVKEKLEDKIAEKIVEGIIEKGTDGEVDIDIDDDEVSIISADGQMVINTGKDIDWSKDMPKDIPEWKGDIVGYIAMDNGFSLGSENVKKDEYEEYIKEVENAGFESSLKMDADGIYTNMYTLDDIMLTVAFSEPDKTISIIATWEK